MQPSAFIFVRDEDAIWMPDKRQSPRLKSSYDFFVSPLYLNGHINLLNFILTEALLLGKPVYWGD